MIDRLAIFLAEWALRRLFGPPCATDYRDDTKGDVDAGTCPTCEAHRLIAYMKGHVE